MKKKVRKSQASIITVVLIIFLVLVAIVILWNVVNPMIRESGEQVKTDQFANTVTIESVKYYVGGDLEVKVKKDSGKEEINSLKFFVYDNNGVSYPVTITNTSLKSLETNTYIFHASDINSSGKIKGVSVFPIINTRLGLEAKAYDNVLKRDSSGNIIMEVPANPGEIGLVSWWKFDGNMLDSAGVNHGTGSKVNLTAGKSGQAYYFNRSLGADNVWVKPAGTYKILNSSVTAWIKKDVLNEWAGIIGVCGLDWYFGITNNSLPPRLTVSWKDSSNIQTTCYSTGRINDNNWHFVGFSNYVLGSTVIVNITLDDVVTSCTKNTGISSSPQAIYIGSYNAACTSGGTVFNGTIDEVMFFNKTLNSDQIRSIYNYYK